MVFYKVVDSIFYSESIVDIMPVYSDPTFENIAL